MSDCRKYMCDKGIHSDAAWIQHRIQLSNEYGPDYKTNPDYIKTMKCRPDVIHKSDCALLFKDRPASGEHLKKLKQYESKLDALKELKLTLEEVKEQRQHDKYDYMSIQDVLRDEPKRVKKLEDALSKRSSAYKHRERDQSIIAESKDLIQYATNKLPAATTQLQKTEARIQQVMHDIEAVKLKLKTKPVQSTRCPKGYKRNKTTKKCDKK